MQANSLDTPDTRMLEELGERRLGSRVEALIPVAWQLVLRVASLAPEPLAYAAAGGMGRLKYLLRGGRIRMRPELGRLAGSEQQLERWKRRMCELFAYEDLDFQLYARGRDPRALISLHGLSHLDEALADGRGAILYSTHVVGVWTFLAALGAHGYGTTVIRYEPAHAVVPMARRLSRQRIALLEERFGAQFHYVEPTNFGIAVKAANALKRNGIVVMLIDKVWSSHSTDVEFLGGTSTFVCGHALLGAVTGAPLLDFYVHRDRRWASHVADIGPPLRAEGSVEEECRRSASRLEDHVRRHPAHWYWYT